MKSALKTTLDEERVLFNDSDSKLKYGKKDEARDTQTKKECDLESDHCFSETYSFVSSF